jgi:hypothetical protein
MSKTFVTSRPLTADEKAQVRPACIWLDFREDTDCNLLPSGTVAIDAVVDGKIVKRNVLGFLRVYEGAEGQYVYPDFKLTHHKVRYWKLPEGDVYVTDLNGDPLVGWDKFYVA